MPPLEDDDGTELLRRTRTSNRSGIRCIPWSASSAPSLDELPLAIEPAAATRCSRPSSCSNGCRSVSTCSREIATPIPASRRCGRPSSGVTTLDETEQQLLRTPSSSSEAADTRPQKRSPEWTPTPCSRSSTRAPWQARRRRWAQVLDARDDPRIRRRATRGFGEAEHVRRRHAEWFLTLAEEAELEPARGVDGVARPLGARARQRPGRTRLLRGRRRRRACPAARGRVLVVLVAAGPPGGGMATNRGRARSRHPPDCDPREGPHRSARSCRRLGR